MLVMVKGYKSLLETKDWQQKSGALTATATWVGWAGGGWREISYSYRTYGLVGDRKV